MSSNGNQRPRWFAPSSIPPILLLTVVTSFAFNHALISTQRKKELSEHRIRTTLLSDTISYNSRLLYHLNPPSKSSRVSLPFRPFSKGKEKNEDEREGEGEEWLKDERESLLRRWKALGLDPVSARLLPPVPRNTRAGVDGEAKMGKVEGEKEQDAEKSRIALKQVTWSEIFLGSKEKRSSLTQRWQKVTAGIKESFTFNNTAPTQTTTTEEEQNELEELSKLWSKALKE